MSKISWSKKLDLANTILEVDDAINKGEFQFYDTGRGRLPVIYVNETDTANLDIILSLVGLSQSDKYSGWLGTYNAFEQKGLGNLAMADDPVLPMSLILIDEKGIGSSIRQIVQKGHKRRVIILVSTVNKKYQRTPKKGFVSLLNRLMVVRDINEHLRFL